jgi:hypothetical protein
MTEYLCSALQLAERKDVSEERIDLERADMVARATMSFASGILAG